MQGLDWNDLRYVLALARGGTHAMAARALGVDATTVARRLRAMEASLGAPLFQRTPDGRMEPSEPGRIAVERAELVEAEVGGLLAALRQTDPVAGIVRVTAVPLLVNRLLIPDAAPLTARHPQLRLELIADGRDLSLTRREADIALRLARPDEQAGRRILARRLGTLPYAAYALAGLDPRTLPWLTYDDAMAHLPQAAWLARRARLDRAAASIVVNDGEGLLQALRAGLGRALLPCLIAARLPWLQRLPIDDPPLPARELWLLTHPDLRHLARVSAVLAWIDELFAPAAISR